MIPFYGQLKYKKKLLISRVYRASNLSLGKFMSLRKYIV